MKWNRNWETCFYLFLNQDGKPATKMLFVRRPRLIKVTIEFFLILIERMLFLKNDKHCGCPVESYGIMFKYEIILCLWILFLLLLNYYVFVRSSHSVYLIMIAGAFISVYWTSEIGWSDIKNISSYRSSSPSMLIRDTRTMLVKHCNWQSQATSSEVQRL